MHFADRLIELIKAKKSAICVGIDPRLDQIPEHIRKQCVKKNGKTFEAASDAFLEFGKGIIDAVCEHVPVVKPQAAFYEQYGSPGMQAFQETCAYAKKRGLLVIADVKRGDIGSTSEAYANAFLGEVDLFGVGAPSFDVDAVTVNSYLGFDGVKPFIEKCRQYGKGIFVLVKTSNQSSSDLQDLVMKKEGLRNYEVMAQLVESWGADEIGESGYSAVGAVVGATFPEEAKRIRMLLSRSIFLVPGYGAQGAGVSDIRHCFNSDNLGAIVNSSRGIIYAFEKSDKYSDEDYKDAARDAVLKMKSEFGGLGIGK